MLDHIPRLLIDLFRLTVWLAIFSVIFVPLERLFPLHPQKVFRKQVAADLGYYFLIGLSAGLVLAAPLAVIAYAARHLIPHAVLATTATWPIWMRASAAVVVGEIGYYWGHRLSHEVPLLWRFHAIHHSAARARRHGACDGRRNCDGRHTRRPRVGILRACESAVAARFIGMATPGFHHWHHTYGLQRNCNYASTLPWIDRLFGSHYLPKVWPSRYGIPEPMAASLTGQLVQPFQEQHAATTTASATERA